MKPQDFDITNQGVDVVGIEATVLSAYAGLKFNF